MRLTLVALFLFFVILTLVLTVYFSDAPQPPSPVMGMNVEVEEGEVRVTNGLDTGTISAGGIARITKDTIIQMKQGADRHISQASDSSKQDTGEIASATPALNSRASESAIQYGTKEYYWIVGYVLSETGEYLENSQISCQQISDDKVMSERNTVSNQDGYYALELPDIGLYRVTSTPSTEYFEKTESATVSKESPSAVIHFLHEKGALVLQGKVVEKNSGDPIADAEIRLHSNQETKSFFAISGEDGRFLIKNLAEGVFNVFASAYGYIEYDALERRMQGIAEPLADIHVSSDTLSKEYNVIMEKAGAVTVLTVDANQSPVSSVWVAAHPYGNSQDSARNTDANGVAEFTNIPPGKVLFRAKKEGYGETSSEIVETGTLDTPAKVTVVLSAPSSISGRITYQDGSPADGWDVFVHNLSTARRIELASIISTRVKTGADGKYTIPGLGKGEYTFYIFKYGDSGRQRVRTDRVITLQDGEDKQGVDFVIEEGTETVRGIVLSQEGNPIPGAKVMVWPVGGAGPNMISSETFSITDVKGEFSFGKLHIEEGGNIMVEVTAEGYKPFEDGFPLDEYITVTLIPAEAINGIVLDQSTRQPIAGASVILRGQYVRDQIEITNTNGTFQFANFAAGTYQLFTFADGYAYSQTLTFDTESEQPLNAIVLELEKANEFRGIVADSLGKPIQGAIVGLESRMKVQPWDEERKFIFLEAYLTQEDGSFVIPNRGHYADSVIIRHEQFAMAKYPLLSEWKNEQSPVFYLNPGGSIEGVVLDENQKPVVGCQILCLNHPDRLFGGKAVTDPNGYYRIDHLPGQQQYVVTLRGSVEMEAGGIPVNEGRIRRVDFNYEQTVKEENKN